MSHQTTDQTGPVTDQDATVTELRDEIRQHRADLAASVDALAVKLDVKSRAKAKLLELRPLAVPAAAGVTGLTVLVLLVRRARR